MLVADAADPPHSCGSKAPMGPRMSRNSSLTHSQDQSTGAALHDEKDLELAEPVPGSPTCASSGSGSHPEPGPAVISSIPGAPVLYLILMGVWFWQLGPCPLFSQGTEIPGSWGC